MNVCFVWTFTRTHLYHSSHPPNYPPTCTGVGTRNYYRKIGYELDGPYMSKILLWLFMVCDTFWLSCADSEFIKQWNSTYMTIQFSVNLCIIAVSQTVSIILCYTYMYVSYEHWHSNVSEWLLAWGPLYGPGLLPLPPSSHGLPQSLAQWRFAFLLTQSTR